MKRYHSISATQSLEITIQDRGQWTLQDEQGIEYNAALMPSTVNTPLLVLLHLDLGSAGKRFIAVHRGQINADQFRQLRIVLTLSKITT